MNGPAGGARAGSPVAALATPDGSGAVALVRVSGEGSHAIVRALCCDEAAESDPSSGREPAPIERARLRLAAALPSRDDPAISERVSLPVIVVRYRAGRSYTGEESVELLVPAAPVWVRAVLATLESAGVAPAGPGEFTRRAFESGKIDLTRAESVAQLIAAEDLADARAARRTLEGELATAVRAHADRVHDLIALLEAGLDFADQEIDPPPPEEIAAACRAIETSLEETAARPDAASSEGGTPRLLLWGRTNAGKSTLLNALTGGEHALVSPAEGTTTDAVGVPWEIATGAVELFDLPGRKDDLTAIEKAADRLAARALESDDPCLYLLAAQRDPAALLEEWSSLPDDRRARSVAVLTQVDRISEAELDELRTRWIAAGDPEPLAVSAVSGVGLPELRARVEAMFGRGEGSDRGAALRFNDRQRRRVGECIATLATLREELLAVGVTEPEIVVVDLRRAHAALEEITGEIATEETLTRIFSRFCVGK